MLLKGLDISVSVTYVQPLMWNASIWNDVRPDCLHPQAYIDMILRVCAHGMGVRKENFRSDRPRQNEQRFFAVVLGHGLAGHKTFLKTTIFGNHIADSEDPWKNSNPSRLTGGIFLNMNKRLKTAVIHM